MDYKERKELRLNLLHESYEFHFSNDGATGQIEWRKLDVETKLAYEYLFDKGFIHKEGMGRELWATKITPYGIDFIESQPPRLQTELDGEDEEDDNRPNDKGFFG